MTVQINSLSPAALKAAMTSGTESWGQWGNSIEHARYCEPIKSRRLCHCGCRKRLSHIGKANGVGLYWGCELSVRRWVKTGASGREVRVR